MTSNFIRRVAAGICALAIAGVLGALVVSQSGHERADEADAVFSGMLVLEAFECRRAETSHLVLRGLEDSYRPGNVEGARIERSGLDQSLNIGTRDYDEGRQDADLFDYFRLPATTVSGRFVIRMQPPTTTRNDTLILGSFAESLAFLEGGEGGFLDLGLENLAQTPGWSQRSDIYWADLGDIELRSGATLIEFIRDPTRDGVIDMMVGDDTIVDFAGIAFCTEPESSNGLTLWVQSASARIADGQSPAFGGEPSYLMAMCTNDPDELGRYCDPFVGDTSCDTPLPLICYRPGDHPYPGETVWARTGLNIPARFWSGGEFELTLPILAEQFETFESANNYCQAHFGDEWRVADFHIDAQGYRFSGLGRTTYIGRAWVDIRDQPYGTCWSR